ncbi:MAG: transposase [Pseudomonadota bacterium]
MSILSRPAFHDEAKAYEYAEARLWPHGATCPKCGERERVSNTCNWPMSCRTILVL